MSSTKRKRLNSSVDERAANRVESLHADGSSRVQVGNSYTEVHNHEGRQADHECLRDLRTTDPRDDKRRIEDAKGGLLQGSYHWVLEDSNFQQWRQGTNKRLLWVKGDPGKGKTMLLCGLIDELKKSQHALSYFFCQATDSRINNATSVLRGLIYLLVVQDTFLTRHVRNKWDYGGESTFDPPNGWHALCNMLDDILHDHSKPICLIIDALDECDDSSRPSLLNLVVSTASKFHHIKWLVSSRNLPNIERGLGGTNPSRRLDISLEANAGLVSRAVADYIGYKVNNLANMHSETELQKELQETMQDKSNGTFLWVALFFDKLKAEEEEELENNRDILKSLNEMPQGLSNLYARMWAQITSLPSTSANLELCKRILATMFLAYRPLQLQELALLADLKGNFAKYDTLVRLVRRCGSFLSIQQGAETVEFVHQSAKDFLGDNKDVLDGMFPSGMGDGHHQLFSRSVKAMTPKDTGLRQNIYGLRNPGVLTSEIKKPVPDPLAAMRYSCVHWLDHFCEWVSLKQVEGQDGAKEVSTFLQEKYVYWLEALGLCESLTKGIVSIRKLEVLAAYNQWDHLATLVRDARRFVLANIQGIAKAPLQVYVSALIFCPTSSWIRERFKELIPEWIKKKPQMQPEWDACLLTLEGHEDGFEHLVFSPDSRIVAAGDSDGIIEIWDAYTGASLNTIWGDGAQIVKLAFLSAESSTVLASAERKSGRCSINIWDPFNASTLLRTFPMPNEMSSVIAFLAGSETAVCVDEAGTLIKFDLDPRKPLEKIKLLSMPIAVSPDGQTIITHADHEHKHRYQVWDWCNPETARLTLDALFPNKYHPVVISSDNTKLAGCRQRRGYRPLHIDVWDLTKGTCIASLNNSNVIDKGLAFSPDGKVVAFAGLQGTVNLWHTITDTVEVFSGHSATIKALAISPDGRLLASGCEDETVKIWDPTIRTSLSSKSDTQPRLKDILLSPNGLWVASLTNDNIIRIWSSVTGEYACDIQISDPLPKWTVNLADDLEFSPCDRWLALRGPRGHTVLGTTTWEIQGLPHRFPRQVHCVSLSTNILSWLPGEMDTVEIWDLHTRKLISTFSSPMWDKNFDHMLFSPDGQWLALASWEELEIWDWAARECIQVVNKAPGIISWHSTHDSLLRTSRGSYCIQGSTGNCSIDKVRIQVEEDKDRIYMMEDEWVRFKWKPVLWIPPQYRPRLKSDGVPFEERAVDCNKSGVAILDGCNRVIYIDFDLSKIVLNF